MGIRCVNVSTADILGWIAVAVGTTIGMPQLLRLIRTRRVDGLSLTAWRSILVANIAWAAHGVRLAQVPMILTNTIGLFSTLPILYLLAKRFRRNLAILVLPSLVVAAAMVTIDVRLGSAAYGIAAICLATFVNLGQSTQLVRARHVGGVSPLFVTLAVVNQVIWVSWGLAVHDAGTIMTASVVAALTSFNLTWYVLRRRGLRPLFPLADPEPEPLPA